MFLAILTLPPDPLEASTDGVPPTLVNGSLGVRGSIECGRGLSGHSAHRQSLTQPTANGHPSKGPITVILCCRSMPVRPPDDETLTLLTNGSRFSIKTINRLFL
jgi:hypothetical protein